MHRLVRLATFLAPTITLLLTPSPASSQLLDQIKANWGNSRSVTYQITTTYGASANVNASPNLKASAVADLVLKDGTVVTNRAGAVGGSSSADIILSPNGANVSLTGMEASANFNIGEGTRFFTSLESDPTKADGKEQTGSATASASHTMALTVSISDNSFINYIREQFQP